MQKLIDGVRAFREEQFAENRAFFERLAARTQQPIALFITCSDSRVHPNLITQTEPGELFLLRNAGNIVPPHGAGGSEAATIEYSLEVLGIRDIVVCGHSQCGAIHALVTGEALANLPEVRTWCRHAEATRRIVERKYGNLSNAETMAAAAQENVLVQMNHLSTHPPVAARLATHELRVFGWYYDIAEGLVWQYEQSLGRFVPLRDNAEAAQLAPIIGA
jgi:carbonic anhydrase